MTKGHSFGGLAAIIYRLKERRLSRNLTQQ